MPYADREEQREYQRRWMRARRMNWIAENGPCVKCGSSDRLEVDHIDPAKKAKRTASLWSARKEVREKELKKCQVLCHDCHQTKSANYSASFGAKEASIVKSMVKGGMTKSDVARHFGVSRSTIRSAMNGKYDHR